MPSTSHVSDGQLLAVDDSRLKLQTIIRLRWIAILGQLLAIGFVYFGLGFDLPIGTCLGLIALSAWLNVFLAVRFPARHRLSTRFATLLLAYDILQLSALLYMTGGIENPFAMLLMAPVTVSAASLPPRNTIALGCLASVATAVLAMQHWPLPWYPGMRLELPLLYKVGVIAAVNACMPFLALYANRLAREGREMSAALAATEHVLAREQKLHALDGLAAAAAHELGTPLSTIVMTTKEMLREAPTGSALRDDIELLNEQALRCREILQKLTRQPDAQDPMHATVSVSEMIGEALAPYRSHFIPVVFSAQAEPRPDGGGGDAAAAAPTEPVGERKPGVIFGIGNILENAIDFARNKVEVKAEWGTDDVSLVIADDGPGFAPEVMDSLGDPYITTRPAGSAGKSGRKTSGLGLGFFIAKTLLERSGATLSFENRPEPAQGAVVRISWPRRAFEARSPLVWQPPPPVQGRAPGAFPPPGVPQG